MNISVSETVPVRGSCPETNETGTIYVTYQKIQPLGSDKAYARVTGIDCPNADSCTAEQCPIAYKRVYW